MKSTYGLGAWAAACLLLGGGVDAQERRGVDAPEADRSSVATPAGALRATDLLGMRVRGMSGEDIGEIEDLVFSSELELDLTILAIGGFLGIDAKLVAVPYENLRVAADGESFVVPMSEEEAAALPEYSAPRVPLATAASAARPGAAKSAKTPPGTAPPPAHEPDARTSTEANEEAREIFAGDDPRVARGIAASKEAYEDADEDTSSDADPNPDSGRSP